MDSKWDFFISYTQDDRPWAEWIAWVLEEDGHRVLIQAWDFVPGSHWMASMQAGTRDAARTIAVLSDAYLRSVFGGAEVAIKHADWGVPGQGLAVILVQPSPQVLDLQAALLAAIAPYTEAGGTAAAFVTNPGEEITQSTFDWVAGYVPAQIGPGRYTAHITIGFATLDDLKTIQAEPFDAFEIHPASVAVYHLGNNGTARTELKAWPMPN